MPFRSTFLLALSLVGYALGPASAWAQKRGDTEEGSRAYIVVDVRSKKIVKAYKEEERLPVASLAKIVTACVVDDWMDATGEDRSSYMVVPQEALQITAGNPLNLVPGDRITVRDALFSSMIASDNVAALTLADYVGLQMWRRNGGRASDSQSFFVAQMNALANARGMERSNFVNPHGMDDRKGKGVSTAADMARITFYAIQKPSLNFIVRQKHRDVSFLRGEEALRFRLFNTNELVGEHGVDGFKTGRTLRAGDCLVVSARRADEVTALSEGRQQRIPYHLIIVTLGSADRFGQAKRLIDSGFFEYERWIKGNRQVHPQEILAMP
ncbi:MAG: serine hydrolase [Verrucomicrobiota bacterium]